MIANVDGELEIKCRCGKSYLTLEEPKDWVTCDDCGRIWTVFARPQTGTEPADEDDQVDA